MKRTLFKTRPLSPAERNARRTQRSFLRLRSGARTPHKESMKTNGLRLMGVGPTKTSCRKSPFGREIFPWVRESERHLRCDSTLEGPGCSRGYAGVSSLRDRVGPCDLRGLQGSFRYAEKSFRG